MPPPDGDTRPGVADFTASPRARGGHHPLGPAQPFPDCTGGLASVHLRSLQAPGLLRNNIRRPLSSFLPLRGSALLAIPDRHYSSLGFNLLLKITGLDWVISDACSCLTVLDRVLPCRGRARRRHRRTRRVWGGNMVAEACAARGLRRARPRELSPDDTPCGLRFSSGSCSLLGDCASVACRSLIYVPLVCVQSRDGDSSSHVWLCDFSVGRSVVGQQC